MQTTRSTSRATPTALLAGGGLLGSFAVAVASGSRPLGGALLLADGAACATIWVRRHGWGRALALAGADFALFAASHLLARGIGGWPSVLTVSAVMAALAHIYSDRTNAGELGRLAAAAAD